MKKFTLILALLCSIDMAFCQTKKDMGGCNFDVYKLPGNTPVGFCNTSLPGVCNDTLYLCLGQSFQLNIYDHSQPICSSYQWKKNGININTATSYSYMVTDTGRYGCFIACDCATPGVTLGNFIVVTCPPSGIKVNTKSSFLLFPNPTDSKLFIQLDNFYNTRIIIYNTFGKTVLTKKFDDKAAELDISSLDNGVYYISIDTGNGPSMQKIIKNAH